MNSPVPGSSSRRRNRNLKSETASRARAGPTNNFHIAPFSVCSMIQNVSIVHPLVPMFVSLVIPKRCSDEGGSWLLWLTWQQPLTRWFRRAGFVHPQNMPPHTNPPSLPAGRDSLAFAPSRPQRQSLDGIEMAYVLLRPAWKESNYCLHESFEYTQTALGPTWQPSSQQCAMCCALPSLVILSSLAPSTHKTRRKRK